VQLLFGEREGRERAPIGGLPDGVIAVTVPVRRDGNGSHPQRGGLAGGLVFDAVRIRLLEIGEAVKAYRMVCWRPSRTSRGGRSPACASTSPTATSTPPMRTCRPPSTRTCPPSNSTSGLWRVRWEEKGSGPADRPDLNATNQWRNHGEGPAQVTRPMQDLAARECPNFGPYPLGAIRLRMHPAASHSGSAAARVRVRGSVREAG
jgi:hypothetical protein